MKNKIISLIAIIKEQNKIINFHKGKEEKLKNDN
jgi:hypothetical protein